jgi:hypothetical protein
MRNLGTLSMIASLLFTVAGCERVALDRQMQELCKKDGGVKVYETVTLPAAYFEDGGRLKQGPMMRLGADDHFQRIGDDEYRVITTRTYIVGNGADPTKGEGNLIRWQTQVYRWSDKRLLGESVEYWRGGGDGFALGFQPSTNVCPKPRSPFITQVFLKGE